MSGSLFRSISTALATALKLIPLFITISLYNSHRLLPYPLLLYTMFQVYLVPVISNTPNETELPGPKVNLALLLLAH
jgi:hypothetical protein